jgi:hypothetical protein
MSMYYRVSIALATLMLCVLSSGCGCDVAMSKEIQSPDHKWKAVLARRDCGATIQDLTEIFILRNGESIPVSYLSSSHGNIATFDDNHGQAWLVNGPPYTTIAIKLSWKSNQQLMIAYPSLARIRESKLRFHDIKIEYLPYDAPLRPLPSNP